MKKQKITSLEARQNLNINHRKEDRLDHVYMAIDRKGKTIAEMRIYYPNTRAYACLWIFAGEYASGSGQAGGGGYHKQSAAASNAFRAAGVTFANDIHGVGNEAIREAMEVLGRKIKGRQFLTVIETHG